MDAPFSIRFASVARLLADECRRRGVVAPDFRSPPRLVGVDRTVLRRAPGSTVVSVRLRERAFAGVVADMIEGVVVANGLREPEASQVRAALWAVVASEVALAA